MTIRTFNGAGPTIDPTAYIDDTALVIGNVTIGADSSIWPMVVARGDEQAIMIGNNTNIQDGTVIHVTHDHEQVPGGLPTIIGDDVTVGHKALLHACRVGNYCLIGMSATIMDGAVIEDNVIVAGGTLVPPGKVLQSGCLYAGSPVRKGRALSDDEIGYFQSIARHYVKLKDEHIKNKMD